MITQRTLLLYNFGIALIFVAVGFLSLVALDPFTNRTVMPPFDPASLTAIHEEENIDHLRSRATFYFELGRDLKRARYADSDILFHDFRFFCFILGAAFALGGVLGFLATRSPKAAKT
jgi:hypothetical protein